MSSSDVNCVKPLITLRKTNAVNRLNAPPRKMAKRRHYVIVTFLLENDDALILTVHSTRTLSMVYRGHPIRAILWGPDFPPEN